MDYHPQCLFNEAEVNSDYDIANYGGLAGSRWRCEKIMSRNDEERISKQVKDTVEICRLHNNHDEYIHIDSLIEALLAAKNCEYTYVDILFYPGSTHPGWETDDEFKVLVVKYRDRTPSDELALAYRLRQHKEERKRIYEELKAEFEPEQ